MLKLHTCIHTSLYKFLIRQTSKVPQFQRIPNLIGEILQNKVKNSLRSKQVNKIPRGRVLYNSKRSARAQRDDTAPVGRFSLAYQSFLSERLLVS